jgi:hypothetical protein
LGYLVLQSNAIDWDVNSSIFIPAGSGSSGGGGATPITEHDNLTGRTNNTNHAPFAGASTAGFVPDPVVEIGSVLSDDGTWVPLPAPGGSGATEATIAQTAHGFAVLDCIRYNGTSWVKALANSEDTTALGVVVGVPDVDTFTYAITGRYEITSGLTNDNWYFLSDVTPGGLVDTAPAIEQPIVYIEGASWVSIYAYRPSTFTESPETGIPEAPEDDIPYARKNALWVTAVETTGANKIDSIEVVAALPGSPQFNRLYLVTA